MEATLEERVGTLERQVEVLKTVLPTDSPVKDWRTTFGWARNCEEYDRAMDLGEEYRKSQSIGSEARPSHAGA